MSDLTIGNCCSCGYTGEMCVGRFVTKCSGCWKIMRTCGRCHQGMSRETWGAVMFLYTVFVACFLGLYLMYAPHASPARLGTVLAVGGMMGCASAITIVCYKAKVGRMTVTHEWKRYDVVAEAERVLEGK